MVLCDSRHAGHEARPPGPCSALNQRQADTAMGGSVDAGANGRTRFGFNSPADRTAGTNAHANDCKFGIWDLGFGTKLFPEPY